MPPHLRLIKGAKRRQPSHVPPATLPPDVPTPPDHLTGVALAEWSRIVPLLQKAGLLTALDRAAVAAYATAFGRWQEAERLLLGAELTISTVAGSVIQNPLIGVANKAMRDAIRIGEQIGVGPASRGRLGVTVPSPDPASRYFDPA